MPINERGNLPLTKLDPDRCPRCSVSLIGNPIPQDQRVGRSTHYRREIGVETDDYDGMLYLCCPDCGWAWSRFVGGRGEGSFTALAKKHVDAHNARLRDDWDEIRARFIENAPRIMALLTDAGWPPTGWRCDIPFVVIDLRVKGPEPPDDWQDEAAMDAVRAQWNSLSPAIAAATEMLGIRVQTTPVSERRPWVSSDRYELWPT